VFVFPRIIEEAQWSELNEGEELAFTVEKNNTGNLLLRDFGLAI
jgi:hypothetical protein